MTAAGRPLPDTMPIGEVSLRAFTSPHVDADGTPDPSLDPEPAALALINSAKVSLWVNAYSFTLTSLSAAIIARHQAGVTVRVVQDATEYTAANSQGPVLLGAGIDLRIWGSEYQLAHEKVLVADSAVVLSGSWNFTTTAEKSNREVCTVVSGVEVQRRFAPLLTAQINATYALGTEPAPTPVEGRP